MKFIKVFLINSAVLNYRIGFFLRLNFIIRIFGEVF